MKEKIYWFIYNGSRFLTNLIVSPIYISLFFIEAIYDGIKYTLECDGSTPLLWPWEMEWPFFREED